MMLYNCWTIDHERFRKFDAQNLNKKRLASVFARLGYFNLGGGGALVDRFGLFFFCFLANMAM